MFMANKTNIQTEAKQALNNVAANAGLLLMTAAATTLMLEMPDHPNAKATLNTQPVFAAPGSSAEHQLPGNELRREREEAGPHYISYGVSQRTPGRTGKI